MGGSLEDFIQAIILVTNLPLDIIFDFYILFRKTAKKLNAFAFFFWVWF